MPDDLSFSLTDEGPLSFMMEKFFKRGLYHAVSGQRRAIVGLPLPA
jgi:hypothetical protein